jgi:hypothetical protein
MYTNERLERRPTKRGRTRPSPNIRAESKPDDHDQGDHGSAAPEELMVSAGRIRH